MYLQSLPAACLDEAGGLGLLRYGIGVGTPLSTIARVVAVDEDTVRDVVHAFN